MSSLFQPSPSSAASHPFSSFWDNISRIYSPLYIPTDEDILRIRVRTQGFDEAVYHYKDFKFRVTDLGGQRIERKHWPGIIDAAHTLMFVSALTEWDQRLADEY